MYQSLYGSLSFTHTFTHYTLNNRHIKIYVQQYLNSYLSITKKRLSPNKYISAHIITFTTYLCIHTLESTLNGKIRNVSMHM